MKQLRFLKAYSSFQVTSDVTCLETYKNIKPLNLQALDLTEDSSRTKLS